MLLHQRLLVVVFHIALVVFGESCHDDVITLLERVFDIVRSLARGEKGRMNDQSQAVPVGKMKVAHSWHHIETSIDGDGHNRQLEFVCQLEGSSAENAHVSGESARTFGENG